MLSPLRSPSCSTCLCAKSVKWRQTSSLWSESRITRSLPRRSVPSILDPQASWRCDRKPPTGWPGQGAVHFVNYSTRYRPGLDLVLRGIEARVKPHEKIGIVGRTGAGGRLPGIRNSGFREELLRPCALPDHRACGGEDPPGQRGHLGPRPARPSREHHHHPSSGQQHTRKHSAFRTPSSSQERSASTSIHSSTTQTATFGQPSTTATSRSSCSPRAKVSSTTSRRADRTSGSLFCLREK